LVLAGAVLAAGGCNPPGQGKKGGGAHDHGETGPHDGLLIELGNDEYHAEFLPDHAKKQATVWILDKKAKNPVPVKASTVSLTITNVTPPLKVALKAEPEKGETPEMASRYVGTDDKFGVEMEFKGTVSVEINGKQYTQDFEEKAHHKDEKKK
jgi:hypothetical protein